MLSYRALIFQARFDRSPLPHSLPTRSRLKPPKFRLDLDCSTVRVCGIRDEKILQPFSNDHPISSVSLSHRPHQLLIEKNAGACSVLVLLLLYWKTQSFLVPATSCRKPRTNSARWRGWGNGSATAWAGWPVSVGIPLPLFLCSLWHKFMLSLFSF